MGEWELLTPPRAGARPELHPRKANLHLPVTLVRKRARAGTQPCKCSGLAGGGRTGPGNGAREGGETAKKQKGGGGEKRKMKKDRFEKLHFNWSYVPGEEPGAVYEGRALPRGCQGLCPRFLGPRRTSSPTQRFTRSLRGRGRARRGRARGCDAVSERSRREARNKFPSRGDGTAKFPRALRAPGGRGAAGHRLGGLRAALGPAGLGWARPKTPAGTCLVPPGGRTRSESPSSPEGSSQGAGGRSRGGRRGGVPPLNSLKCVGERGKDGSFSSQRGAPAKGVRGSERPARPAPRGRRNSPRFLPARSAKRGRSPWGNGGLGQ